MKNKPLTRHDLDEASRGQCQCGCGKPFTEDNPMNIAGQCHFPTRCKVEYWDGVLSFYCAVCEQFICDVKVAE